MKIAACGFASLLGTVVAALAVPPTFNYQGRLLDGTNLVNATVGLELKLYDASASGNLLYVDSNQVAVADGLYSTLVGDGTSFGSLDVALTNAQVWLQVVVNGEALSPRERIVSVAYAMNVNASGIEGTIADSSLSTNVARLNAANQSFSGTVSGNFSGAFSGNGSGVTNVSAANIAGLPSGIGLSTNAADPAFYSAGWTNLGGVAATSSWVMASASAAFGSRQGYPAALAFSNKLWMMAGDGGPNYNDVWSSADGTTWSQVTPSAAWDARSYMGSAVFSNKLWLLGGVISSNGALCAEVWSSPNGTNWSMVNRHAAFSNRYGHSVIAFSNKLWVLGGINNAGSTMRDVWYSPDGTNWTVATTNAAWNARCLHQTLVMSNAMWVIGGGNAFLTTFYHDVFKSTDGSNWTLVTATAAWTNRAGFGAIVDFTNRMYVMGGQITSLGNTTNDCWASYDGATWTRTNTLGVVGTNGIWSARQPSAVYLGNRIWVYGGAEGYSDVWRTTLPAPPDGPGYSAAIGTQTFHFYTRP